jgi:type VI secretion system protein ImpM
MKWGKLPFALSPSSGKTEIHVGGFGKIPCTGDFVRVRADAATASGFESWLERATAWAETRHGRRWQETRLDWPIHAFVYRPPRAADGKKILAGVIRPSHDSVHRAFPLTTFATIPRGLVERRPHALPLLLGDFLEGASEVLAASANIASAAQFNARVSQVRPPDLSDTRDQEYEAWTRSTSIAEALAAIFPDPRSSAPAQALTTIMEALRPFREVESPVTTLAIRVPLGRGGSAAAAFWIDIVRHVARWKATVPVCFWSFDGQRGSMLIQLGDPPPNSLAELWLPDPNGEYVCDLAAGSAVERALALSRLPRRVASLMDSADAPVSELTAALAE